MLSGFVTKQHVSCHVTLPLLPRPGTRLPDEPQFFRCIYLFFDFSLQSHTLILQSNRRNWDRYRHGG